MESTVEMTSLERELVIAASPAGGQATAAGIFRELRSAGYLPGSVVIQSGALLVFS